MIDANEKDLADHNTALLRFGGKQPKGNGSPKGIVSQPYSHLVEQMFKRKTVSRQDRKIALLMH